MTTKRFFVFLFSFIFLIHSEVIQAHEPDHSYIFLRINENSVEGRFEIGRLDFNKALGLNLSSQLTQDEINPHLTLIKNYILSNAQFSIDGAIYPIKVIDIDVFNLDEEDDNIRVIFEVENLSEIPSAIDISYSPFFTENPNHKGMLVIEYHWKAGIIDNYSLVAEIFQKGDTSKVLNLQDVSVWNGFVAMVKLGMWHIWIGIDHILFLVALVLPAVVRRKSDHHQIETLSYSNSGVWSPVSKFKPAALYILKIVTFFTIAHSITLAIASLEILTLPSKYVESVIAFSIALAAFHNIRPIFKSKEWVVAFVFGLFHGFGFASVLGEKGLGGDYFLLSLLGFNGGVEIGQVAIIGVVFPVLFLIRTYNFYPKFLTYGSGLLILVSLQWTIERLFEVNLPIGRWVSSIFNFILF